MKANIDKCEIYCMWKGVMHNEHMWHVGTPHQRVHVEVNWIEFAIWRHATTTFYRLIIESHKFFLLTGTVHGFLDVRSIEALKV